MDDTLGMQVDQPTEHLPSVAQRYGLSEALTTDREPLRDRAATHELHHNV